MREAVRKRNAAPVDDTIATPEGDNEFEPDQPLRSGLVEADVDGLQQWPSNSAMEYDKDRRTPENEREGDKPEGMRRVIDEVSTGKILPG